MATFDAADIQANAELDTFIPELWSSEIIASSEINKVLANLVTNFDHAGKKGDVVHIPRPLRGAASQMIAGNAVTLVNTTEETVPITIDQWWEYSRLISDLAKIQAIDSYRMFYTEDAGEALARKIDTDLHTLGATLHNPVTYSDTAGTNYSTALIGSDMTTFWDPTASTNTGNGAHLTDAGIRHSGLLLDLMGCPTSNRVWVVPPESKESLLGVSRFTEQAFVGEGGMANSIRSGLIGNLYGDPVYVSNNCKTIQATDASTNYRVGMHFHKSAFALVSQKGITMETSREALFKSDLMSADVVYGTGPLTTFHFDGASTHTEVDFAIAFVVPAAA